MVHVCFVRKLIYMWRFYFISFVLYLIVEGMNEWSTTMKLNWVPTCVSFILYVNAHRTSSRKNCPFSKVISFFFFLEPSQHYVYYASLCRKESRILEKLGQPRRKNKELHHCIYIVIYTFLAFYPTAGFIQHVIQFHLTSVYLGNLREAVRVRLHRVPDFPALLLRPLRHCPRLKQFAYLHCLFQQEKW